MLTLQVMQMTTPLTLSTKIQTQVTKPMGELSMSFLSWFQENTPKFKFKLRQMSFNCKWYQKYKN